MSKAKKAKPIPERNPLHPEKKLVTRRDFLSSGILTFSAGVMLPTIFDLAFLERAARAGECETSSALAPGMMPFLIFDCAGGAALSGNWLPSLAEGSEGPLLPSYSRLGLMDQSQWQVDRSFGAPMAAPRAVLPDIHSQIYVALAALPQEIRNSLRMGIIAHTSLSDSQTNQLSAVSLVTAAGVQGTRIKNGLGMRNSPSAGNSDAASPLPGYRPMGINSVASLTSALSYGPAFESLPTKVKEALAKALSRLSQSQAQKLSQMTLGDQFGALVSCGFMKNVDYASGGGGIDARGDASVASIYGIGAGSNDGDSDVVIATLVKAAIEGSSGPAVITIGGCDYHTGTRTNGDTKDAEIGTRIAQAIQVAAAKGKKVAFQIFTDGGISSDENTRNWRGDDNDKSLTVFGVYDPEGPREMVSHQLGRYTTGQGADRTHFLGTDPARVAHTVFLNYLAACGQMSRYPQFADRGPLDGADLDSLLLFPNKA